MSPVTGLIFDIKRFAIHDGPGIRSTVFLKGCPLRCPWCHNPESFVGREQILFYPDRCVQCGRCAEVCSDHHTMMNGRHHYQRGASCERCVVAAEVCPSEALVLSGRVVTADEVLEELVKDRPYYEESSGGVTLSGGEPLAQAAFSEILLSLCGEAGLHRCVDTSGYAAWESIDRIRPFVDLFLYDYKETDPVRHKEWTGVPRQPIVENLGRLGESGASIALRCPVVPGFNDREDHFDGIAKTALETPGIGSVQIMPYHGIGVAKYRALGIPTRTDKLANVTRETAERWVEAVRGALARSSRRDIPEVSLA